MSPRIQSSSLFKLTIIVALALIGWAAVGLIRNVRKVEESGKALQRLRDEYVGINRFVETNMDELNDAVSDFVETKAATNRTRFFTASAAWDRWLTEKRRLWTEAINAGDRESTLKPVEAQVIREGLLPLLGEIGAAYTNYFRAARFLINNAATASPEETRTHQQNAQRARSRLLILDRDAEMRAQAMNSVLLVEEQIGPFQKPLHQLGFGFLLVVVGLCFLLGTIVYRRRMTVSQTIIQEHQYQRLKQQTTLTKLAHFGRLAQELAHEIKQPLTAINARAYTLHKILPAGSDLHKDAAVIRNEIKRLDRIVKDFLELARPSEPTLVPLAAQEALEEVRELLAPQLAQDSVEFKSESEEDLQLLADPEQLKQVLINLVKNAAESMSGSGAITLRARKATRTFNGHRSEVAVLEVEDTGPGIAPEIQTKIFDPFFSTKGDGTGLGLAIASRIIDKHGGNLEFDTQLGKGTIFRIILPICQKEQSA